MARLQQCRDETAVPEGGSAARVVATGRGASDPVAGATSARTRGLRGLARRLTPAGDPHSLPVSLFRYVMQFSLPQQAVLMLLTLASLPVYYVSLDLPKQIVDRAIGGAPAEFPKTPFCRIRAGVVQPGRVSGLSLRAVPARGAGERRPQIRFERVQGSPRRGLLRRLRAQLLSRILRFPLPQFRKLSQGELIAMVTGEVEALGGYFGDALVTPMFQAGLLLTALGFIFAQDLIMGLAAIALYPFQAYVIPKLRRQVAAGLRPHPRGAPPVAADRRGDRRDRGRPRQLADRTQLASLGQHLDRIFRIRYDIYRKKFFIKFLNNFIAQLTPFFFLSIGGYLVLRGSLTLGSLVAFSPRTRTWRRPGRSSSTSTRSSRTRGSSTLSCASSSTRGPAPATRDRAAGRRGRRARGRHPADDLGLEDDGHVLLDQVSLKIPAGQHVALLNENGDGAQALFRMLARLAGPTSGRLMLDGQELSAVPRASYARQVAVVPSPARLTQGTVAENLLLRLGAAAGGASELALDETLATFDQVELAATCSSSACARSSIQSATARWSSGSRRPQRPP